MLAVAREVATATEANGRHGIINRFSDSVSALELIATPSRSSGLLTPLERSNVSSDDSSSSSSGSSMDSMDAIAVQSRDSMSGTDTEPDMLPKVAAESVGSSANGSCSSSSSPGSSTVLPGSEVANTASSTVSSTSSSSSPHPDWSRNGMTPQVLAQCVAATASQAVGSVRNALASAGRRLRSLLRIGGGSSDSSSSSSSGSGNNTAGPTSEAAAEATGKTAGNAGSPNVARTEPGSTLPAAEPSSPSTLSSTTRISADTRSSSTASTSSTGNRLISASGSSWSIISANSIVAGALNLAGSHALYGRNWGCVEGREWKNLHFELCYYQVRGLVHTGLAVVSVMLACLAPMHAHVDMGHMQALTPDVFAVGVAHVTYMPYFAHLTYMP